MNANLVTPSRLADSLHLYGTVKRSRKSVYRLRLVVVVLWIIAVFVIGFLVENALFVVTLWAMMTAAMYLHPKLVFGRYVRYEQDWELANSSVAATYAQVEAAEMVATEGQACAIADLREAFESERDRDLLLIDSLRRLGGSEARDAIVAFTDVRNPPGLRVFATTVLGDRGFQDQEEVLRGLLEDPEGPVRMAAVESLVRLNRPLAHEIVSQREHSFGLRERISARRGRTLADLEV